MTLKTACLHQKVDYEFLELHNIVQVPELIIC